MTWLREMLHLIREYRKADREYKAALKALEARLNSRGFVLYKR